MNKAEAKRIARLITWGQIRNFVGSGGLWDRWPEADVEKISAALDELAERHERLCGDAVIPSEGGDERLEVPSTEHK